MIGVPVNWLHVGAILLCFLCLLSLYRKYLWLGGSLPQPPSLRGVISLWPVLTTLCNPETRLRQFGVCYECEAGLEVLMSFAVIVQYEWHFSRMALSIRLNTADRKEVENKRTGGGQLLYCDFAAAERRRILSSFLSAHLNHHFSTLKGSINRGALLYFPSLPAKSFFFRAKRRLTLTFKHSQTLFPPRLSSFFMSLSPPTLSFCPLSPFHPLAHLSAIPLCT